MTVLTDPSALPTIENLDDDCAVTDFAIPVEVFKYDTGELDTPLINTSGNFLAVNNIS